MTFDIAMDNAEVVHVQVDTSAVKSNSYSHGQGDFDSALHVKHIKQTVVN